MAEPEHPEVQWEFTPMPSSGQSLESIATELMTSSAMPCLSWRPFNQNQAQALSFVLQQVDGLWPMLFKRSNLSTTKYLLEVRSREKGYLVYKHVKVQDVFLCKPIRVIRFQLVVEVTNAESCRLRVELSSQAPFEFCTAADPHCRVMYLNNDQKVAYLHDSAVAMAREIYTENEVSTSKGSWQYAGLHLWECRSSLLGDLLSRTA